eukprot:SAG11_NODE_7287_length_1166_cov_1.145267_1_plen_161_part_10
MAVAAHAEDVDGGGLEVLQRLDVAGGGGDAGQVGAEGAEGGGAVVLVGLDVARDGVQRRHDQLALGGRALLGRLGFARLFRAGREEGRVARRADRVRRDVRPQRRKRRPDRLRPTAAVLSVRRSWGAGAPGWAGLGRRTILGSFFGAALRAGREAVRPRLG